MSKYLFILFVMLIYFSPFMPLVFAGEYGVLGYVPDINECKNIYLKWPDKRKPMNKQILFKMGECSSLENEIQKTKLSINTPNKLKWLSSDYRAQMQQKRTELMEEIKECRKELDVISGLSLNCDRLLRPPPKNYGTYNETEYKIEELEDKIDELEMKIEDLEN